MAATPQELLDAVNDAILAILTGGAVKSYGVGNRNLSRMSIKDLYNMRAKLEAQVSAATGSTNYAEFKDAQ